MRIQKEVVSEDCFDGNFIKEYEVTDLITRDFIEHLRKITTGVVLDLKEPFYSFDFPPLFTLKGITGTRRIRVIYRRNNMRIAEGFFPRLMEFPCTPAGQMKSMYEQLKKRC